MAHYPNSRLITTGEALADLVTLPFRTLWTRLAAAAEASPRFQTLRKLHRTSDETLSARGLTRLQAGLRVLGRGI